MTRPLCSTALSQAMALAKAASATANSVPLLPPKVAVAKIVTRIAQKCVNSMVMGLTVYVPPELATVPPKSSTTTRRSVAALPVDL